MFVDLLIKKNRRILEQMIEEGVDYAQILKQSQKLDIYINKKMQQINKEDM